MYDGQTKRERGRERARARALKASDENHSLTFTDFAGNGYEHCI